MIPRLATALAVSLVLCGCSTKLVRTSSEYRPVTPERARLRCEADLPPTYSSPTFTVTLSKDVLAERVETQHMRTSYSWLNRSLALALMGGSGLYAYRNWDYREVNGDTITYPRRVLGIVGAAVGAAWALFASDGPFKARHFEKQVLHGADTTYTFAGLVIDEPVDIGVAPLGSNLGGRTDAAGKLLLSARDYYGVPLTGDGVTLRVSAERMMADLVLPSGYLARAKAYDSCASALEAQAAYAELGGRLEEAAELYGRLIATYPDATVSGEAKSKQALLRERVRVAKLITVRGRLAKVDDDKVRAAIASLRLSEYESNSLAYAVENLGRPKALTVMRDGLGLPLEDSECAAEYGRLTLFQKFYAVVTYRAARGGDLSGFLGVTSTAGAALATVRPEHLLR